MELVQCDVSDDASVKAAAATTKASLESKGATLFALVNNAGIGPMSGYGTSKALLTAYTMAQAKAFPNLGCYCLSPGFIQTKLTDGWGAKLTPEQGCVVYLRVLFEPGAVSGYFYGSDGLRSPITMTRDPGTKEYGGEP